MCDSEQIQFTVLSSGIWRRVVIFRIVPEDRTLHNHGCENLIIYIFTFCFLISLIHQWLYSPLLGPGLFISFVIIFTQTVELLGRVIRPSKSRYLHTGQHKHRINSHTDIYALSEIRTQDSSVRASEDNSCLRPRGHCDPPLLSNIDLNNPPINTHVSE
jgi:hypothetical protein